MSTHMPGFHFSGFLHHFVLAKLATTSMRVKQKKSSTFTFITNTSISNRKVDITHRFEAKARDKENS